MITTKIHHRFKYYLQCLLILCGMLFSPYIFATQASVTQALVTQTLVAQALPEFNARYAIQKFDMKLAEAHYQLSYTERGYKFTQNTNLYGFASLFANDSISAVSYIDKSGDNLLLTKHRYIQTGREENRNEDIDILWQTHKNTLRGKVTGVVRSKAIEHHVDAEIWDVLSFQIPLMTEASENIKQYPYQAILKGEINDYNFVLAAVKTITFAGNDYKSLQLIRTDPNRDRQLHIWLIPALHNIPYLIVNYRDGKEHSRGQLESVNFNNEVSYTEQLFDNDDDY